MQGKAQGIQGICQLTASGNMTYDLLCATHQEPSREMAGNNGPDRGVRFSGMAQMPADRLES
jgi:hypothetical protein